MAQDLLDLIRLLDCDAHANGIDGGFNHDSLIIVSGDRERGEQNFLGCSICQVRRCAFKCVQVGNEGSRDSLRTLLLLQVCCGAQQPKIIIRTRRNTRTQPYHT